MQKLVYGKYQIESTRPH